MYVSSASSASIHSTPPFRLRSLNRHFPIFRSSRCFRVRTRRPFFTTRSGRRMRPSSQFRRTSLMFSSKWTFTSGERRPVRRRSRISEIKAAGSSWRPTRSPFTYTRVAVVCPFTWRVPRSARRSFTSSSGNPSDTSITSAQFFTRPQFCPSGVSFGHSRPHCVGCRSRASKCGWDRVSGDVTLRRWLRADMFDVRSRSWLTPARPPTQEDGLLDPVLPRVAEVGEQGAVEDRFDLFRPVFLRLPRREFLLEVVHRVVAGEDPTRRVQLLVLALLNVRVHDVRHLRNGDDGVVDLLVLLRAEGFHQD